jgi:hypothetical protein
MSEINGLPAAFTEIIRLQAEISKLNAALTESRFQCEHKEREFWRIQRICTETGQRCDAELREMRDRCEAMRMEKLQIERGLAMLGTDDPTNVIQRLNKELEDVRRQLAEKTCEASLLEADLACCDKARMAELEKLLHEGREQSQAAIYELHREHEDATDSFRCEIYTLEQQLEAAHAALADSKLEIDELKDKLFDAEEETMALRGRMDTEHDSFRGEINILQDEIRALQADVAEKEAALKSANMWLSIEASANVGWQELIGKQRDEIARLNREVAEYADTVDDLTRQTREAAGWSDHPSVAEIARKEKVILKLTGERNVWRNRHAAVTQSAQRLRDELDEASKTVRPSLNPDAEPFIPRNQLNPAAEPFVPAAQGLKAAVQQRLAEKAAEKEAARKATVESFKDAIRVRLAAVPTLTIAEVSVPDYKADWTAYRLFCVTKIQGLLNECAAAVGSANKVPLATQLFHFIKEHGMPLLRAYKKLRLTVISKCWEFKADKNSTAELCGLSDWILEQFKDERPDLSYGCGSCAECYTAMQIHTRKVAQSLPPGIAPDLVAAGVAPSTERADGRQDPAPAPAPAIKLTTPIKRVPAPAPAPAAPVKRYRTRTRTGVIPRRSYAEESDSE